MSRLKGYLGLVFFLLLLFFSGDSGISGYIQAGDLFYDTIQSLGSSTSLAVAAADLDGEGSLDLFVGNSGPNKVYLNNGSGQFTATGQSLGSLNTEGVALADVDNDGDIDALTANTNGLNQVWLNNGSGSFTAGATLTGSSSRGVALGHLDDDNYVDAFIANDGGNTVWFNNGDGTFTDTLQSLGDETSYDVELGYLNADPYLDAYSANGNTTSDPDTVWLNDGNGYFYGNGQTVDFVWSYDVALGDVNGDTFVDAFTASWFPNGNKVWLNDGSGQFTGNGQSLGTAASLGVDVADVDGDNDLDAVVGNNTPGPNRVWLNDGSGQFSAGQGIDPGTTTYGVILDDFDGDLDPDLFFANFGGNDIWNNGVPGTPDAYFAVERESHPDGDYVYYRGQSGNALVPVMLGQPAPSNLNVQVRIEAPGGVTTQTIPFNAGSQAQMLNMVNPGPDPDIVYKLSLFVPLIASPTDAINFVWIDGDSGPSDCILCYLDWLLRFMGFEPTFYNLHHYQLTEQEMSPQWNYYARLFGSFSPTVSGLVAAHPSLAWKANTTFQQWTPAVESLSNGVGDTFVIKAYMIDNAVDMLDELKQAAAPDLAAIIQREEDLLGLEDFVGMTMDQAWDELQIRRPVEELYLTIILKAK